MIFNDNFGVLVFNHLGELTQHSRLTNTSHILQTDFGSTSFNKLVGNVGIILSRVDRRVCDAKRCLWSHACFECVVDRRDDVAYIVQTTEDAGDVNTLSMLNLVHKFTYIRRYGEHTQGVKSAVEHVGFNANFVEGFSKGAYRLIRILAVEEVHLFKSTTICFYSCEASHLYNNRCYTF